MTNPQWLELPVSETNFHGPKDVWVIKVYGDHEIISAVILPLPLIQEGQLSVTGESILYWLTA